MLGGVFRHLDIYPIMTYRLFSAPWRLSALHGLSFTFAGLGTSLTAQGLCSCPSRFPLSAFQVRSLVLIAGDATGSARLRQVPPLSPVRSAPTASGGLLRHWPSTATSRCRQCWTQQHGEATLFLPPITSVMPVGAMRSACPRATRGWGGDGCLGLSCYDLAVSYESIWLPVPIPPSLPPLPDQVTLGLLRGFASLRHLKGNY